MMVAHMSCLTLTLKLFLLIFPIFFTPLIINLHEGNWRKETRWETLVKQNLWQESRATYWENSLCFHTGDDSRGAR